LLSLLPKAVTKFTIMSTQQTAVTQYIEANGAKLAYRRLGRTSGVPLVMLIHFRGNMDLWDPALINRLAEKRPILLFDNSGIGKSSGEVPLTFAGWAANCIALVQALEIEQVDVLGFSMGGCVAQMVALNAPAGLVRKAIFAGTRASISENPAAPDPKYFLYLKSALGEEKYTEAHALSFFNNDEEGQTAARASWARINERTPKTSGEERVGALAIESGDRQTEAYMHFMSDDPTNSFPRLHELKMPVLVVNGDNDLLVPSAYSWELVDHIENAHLHIYPKSGHGFLYQHARLVAQHFNEFLDGEWEVEKASL
jgi:pimeloyl-ACP methyl ester carboxylesterase